MEQWRGGGGKVKGERGVESEEGGGWRVMGRGRGRGVESEGGGEGEREGE